MFQSGDYVVAPESKACGKFAPEVKDATGCILSVEPGSGNFQRRYLVRWNRIDEQRGERLLRHHFESDLAAAPGFVLRRD